MAKPDSMHYTENASDTLPQVYFQNGDTHTYPEVVPKSYPEVAHYNPPEPIPIKTYPEAVYPAQPPYHDPASAPPPAYSKSWCGLSKKWVALLALAALAVLLGAVLGGVFGSRATASGSSGGVAGGANNGTAGGGGGGGGGNPTPTSTAPTTFATRLAASVNVPGKINPNGNEISTSVQIFSQSNDPRQLRSRVYVPQGQFGPEYSIDMSLPPPSLGPLAVASGVDGSNNSLVNLFYLYKTASSVDIALANLKCDKGAASCYETESEILTRNVRLKVHPETNLAALWLTGGRGARVYYQATTGELVELNGEAVPTQGWVETALGVTAFNGTGLAAAARGSGAGLTVHVYHAAPDGRAPNPSVAVLSSGAWSSGGTIDDAPPKSYSPKGSFTACYQNIPDLFRFYFVSPEVGQINEYVRARLGVDWARQPTSWTWLRPDSDPGMICYVDGLGDQGRMYYRADGRTQESFLVKQVWEKRGEMDG